MQLFLIYKNFFSNLKEKDEWIYIATTDQYAKNCRFKIGSTKNLSKRLHGYQTGRPSDDEMFYCWTYRVYDAAKMDSLIQNVLFDFKDREMYIFIFKDLVELVESICKNGNTLFDQVYDYKKNRLPEAIVEQDQVQSVPPKITLPV